MDLPVPSVHPSDSLPKTDLDAQPGELTGQVLGPPVSPVGPPGVNGLKPVCHRGWLQSCLDGCVPIEVSKKSVTLNFEPMDAFKKTFKK